MRRARMPDGNEWYRAISKDPIFSARYRLGRILGRGSQGVVVRVRELATGQDRTVKFLRRSGDALVAARFAREARLLVRLRHPNVVAVLDAGRVVGLRYLVTEFVPGGSLAERMRPATPMPAVEAIPILLDVLDALEACHAVGVVHRDLKPANILLTRSGRARLIDFGIARDLECDRTELTGTGVIVGTPRYMSPEQARGESAGPASDIFAAGAILYELLSGHPAFDAPSFGSLLTAIQTDAPRPLASKESGVSTRLEAIVLRALARDPADRFGSAAHMASALNEELPLRDRAPVGPGRSRLRSIRTAGGRTGRGLPFVVTFLMMAGLLGSRLLEREPRSRSVRLAVRAPVLTVQGPRSPSPDGPTTGFLKLATEISSDGQILTRWRGEPDRSTGDAGRGDVTPGLASALFVVGDLAAVRSLRVDLAPGCGDLMVNGKRVGSGSISVAASSPIRQGINHVTVRAPVGQQVLGLVTIDTRGSVARPADEETTRHDSRVLDAIGRLMGTGADRWQVEASRVVEAAIPSPADPFRRTALARLALEEPQADLISRVLGPSGYDAPWSEPSRLQRAKAVLDLLQDLVERDSRRWATWQELGFVLRKCGQMDAARAALLRAVSLFPGNHWTWRDLGLLQHHLALENSTELPARRSGLFPEVAARRCFLAALQAHRNAHHPVPWIEPELGSLLGRPKERWRQVYRNLELSARGEDRG